MTGLALLGAAAALAGAPHEAAPPLLDLRVASGPRPFAGDRRLLATVTPNRDGVRDVAVVHFRLPSPATVRLEAVATEMVRAGKGGTTVVWRTEQRFAAGAGELAWRPAPSTQPRTYILRLTVIGADGSRRVYGAYGPSGRQNAPVVRVQGVEATFTRRSYAPGEAAELRLATDARSLRLQVFAYRSPGRPSEQDVRTNSLAMTGPIPVDWSGHRDRPALLRVVRAGDWPSGLYFLRAVAPNGLVGYAPFIVRPRQLGATRIGVVLATNTWAAYNFEDADGDGWGDSWYVTGRHRSVDLERPFLDFGVPFRFRDWDLEFVAWLNRTGKRVDFLSDDDLERLSGSELARRYDLLVFPGHEEYVTRSAYDAVTRFRDLGGNLAFLAANNYYRQVTRRGRLLVRGPPWRKLGRPESELVGVQYVGSDHGARQAGYEVTGADAAPWAFAGTGLGNGSVFGRYGIEIDSRTPASPRGIQLLARIPQLLGPGRSAEMTYYETPAGARVFAAGAINFAASLDGPEVSRLLENVWARLSVP
jgi:N,N-dimethylformamidase beta subunit-like, C-terminal